MSIVMNLRMVAARGEAKADSEVGEKDTVFSGEVT
jgi:hypothetical protein